VVFETLFIAGGNKKKGGNLKGDGILFSSQKIFFPLKRRGKTFNGEVSPKI